MRTLTITLTEAEARAIISVNHLAMAILARQEHRVPELRDNIYSADMGKDVTSGIKKVCQAVNPLAAAIAEAAMSTRDPRDN